MDGQNQVDSLVFTMESIPSSLSSDSSRSPTDSQSEKSSINDQRTLGSESPPDLTEPPCNGHSSGCYYPENDQPHCHLKCSPRACKQCREVLDADWVEKGRWLEDCISLTEDHGRFYGEEVPMRQVFKIGATVVLVAGVLYCAWQARANWGMLHEWAARWAWL